LQPTTEKASDVGVVLNTLKEWQDQGRFNDPTVQIIAALIFFREHLNEVCFAALFPPKSLEASCLLVQLYLSMNRIDMANKELQRMKERQDDAVQTQVARAWVSIESRDRVEDARDTFQELKGKHGESILLLNGLATACMHMGDFAQAEKFLLNILILDKQSISTKINLFVCASQLGKPKEKLAKDYSQILAAAPNHPWVRQQQAAEQLFDQSALKFAPSK